MPNTRLMRPLWVAGGAGLILSLLIREPTLQQREIIDVTPPAGTWITGGFASPGVYPTTAGGALPRNFPVAGSWLNGDEWKGDAATEWNKVSSRGVRVLVAGYPQHPQCRLWVEFRQRNGTVARRDCEVSNPGENWAPWDFRIPFGAEAFRLVAADHASTHAGWLAFSAPMAVRTTPAGVVYAVGQVLCAVAFAVGIGVLLLGGLRRRTVGPLSWETNPQASPMPAAPAGAWWQSLRLTGGFLALATGLLILRKPWALHTPQLWAEDGSIFLMQADWHGAESFLIPYMGYLHTLPRLVAFFASCTLDPKWWPAFYTGVTLATTVALFARFASPRLSLPGKPWLVLAFLLGPLTGETLLNLTNLQWFTAFFLLQQVLIARPQTAAERAGDLALMALVGLTGPFSIAFLPLFAWRWWRDRHRDNLILLLVVLVCAGTQGWFVYRTGPHFEYQKEAFHALKFFATTGRRLFVWPILGDNLAKSLPPLFVAGLGCGFVAALLLWSLRPHRYRLLRAQVAAAFVLIFLAGVYRTRPDTWAGDNLVYADRYFYIPRVLIAWLLIWEFGEPRRWIAWTARLICLTAALVHLKGYQISAPPDYQWSRHCDPIRGGVRANIPTLPEGWTLEYWGRPPKR